MGSIFFMTITHIAPIIHISTVMINLEIFIFFSSFLMISCVYGTIISLNNTFVNKFFVDNRTFLFYDVVIRREVQ